MTPPTSAQTTDRDAALAMPLPAPRYEIRHGDVWKARPAPTGSHVCDGTGLMAIAFFAESDGGIVAHGDERAVRAKVDRMLAGLDPDEHHVCTVILPVHPSTIRAINLAVAYGWTRETMLACLEHLRSDPTITLPMQIPR